MFIKFNGIFMSRDILLDSRLRAIKLYVYSIFLNDDETWILYLESTKKLKAIEMWMFKRLARVNCKGRMINEEVLSRLDVERYIK